MGNDSSIAQVGESSEETTDCQRIASPYLETDHGHQKYVGDFAGGCFALTVDSNRPRIPIDVDKKDDFGFDDGITTFCRVYAQQAPIEVRLTAPPTFVWSDGRIDEFRFWVLNGVAQEAGETVLEVNLNGFCQDASALYGRTVPFSCGSCELEVSERVWIQAHLSVSVENDCRPCPTSQEASCSNIIFSKAGPDFWADLRTDILPMRWSGGETISEVDCHSPLIRCSEMAPDCIVPDGEFWDQGVFTWCSHLFPVWIQAIGWQSSVTLACTCASHLDPPQAILGVLGYVIVGACKRSASPACFEPGNPFCPAELGCHTHSGHGLNSFPTTASRSIEKQDSYDGTAEGCCAQIQQMLPFVSMGSVTRRAPIAGGCEFEPGTGFWINETTSMSIRF